MSKSPKRLRILIKTSMIISNRETASAFLMYLAYALGGLVLASLAIVPVLAPSSKEARGFLFSSVALVMMFDYVFIQSKLTGTALIDRSTLALFPVSRTRSIGLRFALTVIDKRILFYFFPMLATVAVLSVRGNPAQPVVIFLLYVSVYLIMSEALLAIFPLFRRLANRFSVRTVTQIAMLPLLLVFLLVSVFRLKSDLALGVPVLSEFVRGSQDAIASNIGGALTQLAYLLLTALALAIVFVTGGSMLAGLDLSLPLLRAGDASREREEKPSSGSSSEGVAVDVGERSVEDISVPLDSISEAQAIHQLVLLDWKILQKEERLLYLIIGYPFIAAIFFKGETVHLLHHPIDSLIFPIFFVSLMLGSALTDNYLTKHGLRLKHVSIFPLSRERFVFMKSLSSWCVISLVNLAVTLVLGFMLKIGSYQQFQGVIYSLYLPLVLMLSANMVVLSFNKISRHALISLLIVVSILSFATIIYVLSMMLSVALGLLFVGGLFAMTYFLWIPVWSRKLSVEFQTLLEESK